MRNRLGALVGASVAAAVGCRRRAVVVGAVVAVVSVTAVTGTAWADGHSGGVTSVPVSFDVVARNNSGLPCDTSNPLISLTSVLSNHHETVRGHLTGPSSELDSDDLDGTLYNHGDGYDETFWRFEHDQDYNYVDEMARRGHVSVTIDRLGYGDSSNPNGNTICYGTEASVLHQIIGQLRHGDYHGAHTPRFDEVGLVGHSAGGFVVEQEAAGFHDIHALGVLDSGEVDTQPLVVIRAAQQQKRCFTGTGGTHNGYAPFESSDAQFRHDHIHNVEPDIADYLAEHRTKDACAGARNAVQAIAGSGVRNSLIRVPVLVLGGAEDMFFQRFGLQAKEYTQSRKVTVRVVPRTGHAVAFSREHHKFYDYMNDWLDDNHL